jgi:hypothetical protein
MDEEPFIIAAMMAEEEKRRLDRRFAEEKLPFPRDTYRQFQNKQTFGRSTIKWIVIGVLLIIVFLLICR